MSRVAGKKTVSTTIPEYSQRKKIVVTSTDFVWDSAGTNAWFKIVTTEDCLLNVQLFDEDTPASASANATAYGYFPFKAGEGSNARVIKVFTDEGNTIGTATMWAVR